MGANFSGGGATVFHDRTDAPGEIIRELVNASDGQGLHFADTGYIDLTNAAGAEFGTSDFSVEFILDQDGPNVTNNYIWYSHTSGNNRVFVWHSFSAAVIYVRFVNSAGSNTTVTLDYDMSADYGTPTHYALSFDRDGDLILYKNGSNVASVSIAVTAAFDLGDSNTSVGRISANTNYSMLGTFYRFRTWNKALSQAEVTASYENATVPFADQYGSQTELVTNGEFATDTDWTKTSPWSIGSGVATADGTSSNRMYQSGVDISVGKTYRYSFDWTRTGGTSIIFQYHTGSGYVDVATITDTGSGTATGTFTIETGTNGYIYFLANGNWAGTIDNVTVVAAGCVADYDLAFANPTQSLLVQDRAGAADGTASSSGVTQVTPIEQLNAKAARIGTSAAAATPADGDLLVSGNVGIGTTSPGAKLHVSGDNTHSTVTFDTGSNYAYKNQTLQVIGGSITGASTVNLGYNGNLDEFSFERVSNALNIKTDGAEIVTFKNTGNVGIGTTGPGAKLEIKSTLNGSGIGLKVDTHTRTGGENYIWFGDAATPDFLVNTNGNVGIGTDSPSAKLHVECASGSGGRVLFGGSTSSAYNTNINVTDTGMELWAQSNARGITFSTGSTQTERMRINSSGNVGIGAAIPGAKLEVNSGNSATDSVLRIAVPSVATADPILDFYAQGTYGWRQGIDVSDGNKFKFDKGNGVLGSDTLLTIDTGGKVGIGTTAPGQLLDVNSGGGNMIADGYDTHSLAVYKENIEDASGYLDKVLACPSQKWNRKPFVSADEIKEAVLEEFGEDVLIEEAVEAQDAVYETVVVQEAVEEELWAEGDELPEGVEIGDVKTEAQEEETEEQLVSEAIEAKDAVYEKQYSVWDELFPEDNSHRQKALYNMPDGDLKTWIDDWCEAKRVEMRPEPRWQKKRLGLVADAELTAEHLPEVISINDEGEPTGIDTMAYIGILHNAIQELSAKVEALENQ